MNGATNAPAPPDAPPGAAPSAQPEWVRLLVLVLGAVGTLGALGALPVLFAGDDEVPGPGLAGWTVTLGIALRAPLAIAALVFAARKELPRAVVFLAAAQLASWLTMTPSVALHGLEWDGTAGLYTSAQFLLTPVMMLAAAALAWRAPDKLGTAAILVALPTLATALGVVIFAIGVGMYGF